MPEHLRSSLIVYLSKTCLSKDCMLNEELLYFHELYNEGFNLGGFAYCSASASRYVYDGCLRCQWLLADMQI